MKTKVCSKCGIEKELTEFYKIKGGKYGVMGECKKCRNAKAKEYELNNYQYIKNYRNNYYKEYFKKKRNINPLFRLRVNVSSSTKQALKSFNADKGGKSFTSLTGWNIKQLQKHLIIQACLDGINWNDYLENPSDYHLDHIIPQSKYKNKEEYLSKCWDLKNLRIFPAIENQIKSASINISAIVFENNIEHLLPADLEIEKPYINQNYFFTEENLI